MQPGNDQDPVKHAEDERAEAAAFKQQHPQAIDAFLNRRPDQAEQGPQGYGREPGDDGHKTPPAKKRQVFRQLDVLEAVVQRPGHQAADNPGEHAHVDMGVERLEGRDQHQITDRPGQACGAVVIAGKTHGNADSEDQRQVGENRVAGIVDDCDVEQVGVAQTQQQPGNGQNRNRQHQRPAKPLQTFDEVLIHERFSVVVFVVVSRKVASTDDRPHVQIWHYSCSTASGSVFDTSRHQAPVPGP